MADKPRPEEGKEKEKITVGQINVTRALIDDLKWIISSPFVWLAR